ncbi:intraflagellar transport protein 172 homolog [Onthophagus taurus]|uniref:intraflagellar transport protein 172 homolog n=1 Tax=Onthophagus taurus TaxID=166361 RepID=UPI0039BE4700
MQFKYVKNILESYDVPQQIICVAWSPNSAKLAAATSERQILLFDENGEKKDHFSTKPSNSEAGKKSYIIKSVAFNSDSTKLAVAQTDCIVFVYRLGEKWGEKKAICNKFMQSSSVTSMIWLLSGPIIAGLVDGRVRALQIKSNKSQSLYSADSMVVYLCSNMRGTGFLSGHVDGNVIRFYVNDDDKSQESQGRVFVHPVPPCALSWLQNQIFVGGCDKRAIFYNNQGKVMRQFDYSRDNNEKEFTVACSSPSGQAVMVGSFDRLRVYTWNPRNSLWEESTQKEIKHFYTVSSISWNMDGFKVVVANNAGSLLLFETVLRRTFWKDKYEITFVGPSQILIKPLIDGDYPNVVINSYYGKEIDDIKIMGKDNYAVARTSETLIVGDLRNNLVSEVLWTNTGRHEKFYFDNQNICLAFNAGELSLIEYGINEVLYSVRTEFANPHLLSVRLNERNSSVDNKKLAYLLDLKTVCVLDLITGVTIAQINHESKIDWLELNETGNRLLFRDVKQRLILIEVLSSDKKCIFSGVSFVQWVEASDVAVAQSGNTLAVWYNIDLPENPTILQVKGDVVDVIRDNGRTQVITIEGSNTIKFDLDEGLVEFGTAVNDNDYGRAVLFLEKMGNGSEADAMWHNLVNIGLKNQDLFLAKRAYAGLGNISKVFFLDETEKLLLEESEENQNSPGRSPEVWAKLAVLNGNLDTAENIYLEQMDLDGALNMYKKLHKWDSVIRLATKSGYNKLTDLKEEHVKLLLNGGQYEKVGQIMEDEGNYEQAMSMYVKSNRLVRASNLLLKQNELISDHSLVAVVLKKLLKHELFESAAEIYKKLDKTELALECYRKGKVWNKAVELARIINPDQVVDLEEEWGDYLVENKQMDAAISHYIEAGRTMKALDSAITARQWKKAVHIIQVIDDIDSVKEYYKTLGQHYASIKEYNIAEKMFIKAEMYKEAVSMYNEAGQWDKAHSIASAYLDPADVISMYIKQAEELEQQGKYREAEKLYVSVDEADLAIAMYKKAEQYDNMIRLVEKYHPDLLPTTHMHLAQQMETQGKYRAAEAHFLAVGEWKSAMNMYRSLGSWEESYRVAKENGGAPAANQVAFLWSRSLPIDSAIKLLNKYGILEACIDYACETYQYDFAFQLCKNLPSKVSEVHYKYAMALEDDGKFSEAESEFIAAGKPKEAIFMYTHCQNWIHALRVAETYDPSAVSDVLQAQALHCFSDGNYTDFESLLLRAQMPEIIVQKYKSSEMWIEALRVCRDYLPAHLPSLQAEYSSSNHGKDSTMDLETILSKANEWALAGQHKQAIDCLLRINLNIADEGIVKRALLKAAGMAGKFLFGQEAIDCVRVLAPRLISIGEHTVAAQLYVNADLTKDAIDTFISAEDWVRARKLAKELEPAYEAYVESRYKDRLLTEGNVEQLADVDIIGALDLLVEQGQWARCIEKAKSHSAPVLHKYVALYASQLIKEGFIAEALKLYITYGVPAVTQNFNIYNQISVNIFSMTDTYDSESYELWKRLRQMLYELNEGTEVLPSSDIQYKIHFKTLLIISHFNTLRIACKQVSPLKGIALKLSVGLLRYTDIYPADKGFYEAGIELRDSGRIGEAFVFLNHYLDICEAIEEGEGQLVDHTDFVQTDFPSNVPIPENLYLENSRQEHDSVREWVLTISMDQNVDQTLPLDDRGMYESSLINGENPCIISGYPLSNKTVTFSKSSYEANKEIWLKINMAAKMYPDSNISSELTFIQNWLGTPSVI